MQQWILDWKDILQNVENTVRLDFRSMNPPNFVIFISVVLIIGVLG